MNTWSRQLPQQNSTTRARPDHHGYITFVP